jgi:hypothetical protein
MAAGRTLWFLEHACQADPLNLQRGRPWYRHKEAPSQLDLSWACREVLQEGGIAPTLRFMQNLTKNHENAVTPLPLAA